MLFRWSVPVKATTTHSLTSTFRLSSSSGQGLVIAQVEINAVVTLSCTSATPLPQTWDRSKPLSNLRGSLQTWVHVSSSAMVVWTSTGLEILSHCSFQTLNMTSSYLKTKMRERSSIWTDWPVVHLRGPISDSTLINIWGRRSLCSGTPEDIQGVTDPQ